MSWGAFALGALCSSVGLAAAAWALALWCGHRMWGDS